MPEIFKADFELRKIMTNGQRTEDQEIKTDTLVLGNANLEMRVKGEPHNFKDFAPGTLITVTFTQSQVTLEAFDKAQEKDELIQSEAEALEEEEADRALAPKEYPALDAQTDVATLKELEADEELEEVDE
jgi:hypothetical protein